MTPIEMIYDDHAPDHAPDYAPDHAPHDWTSDNHEIFVPPSGWKDDVLANIKSQENIMKQKSWSVSSDFCLFNIFEFFLS